MHRLRDHADVETAGSLGDVVIFRIRGLPLLPLLPTFPQHREAFCFVAVVVNGLLIY